MPCVIDFHPISLKISLEILSVFLCGVFLSRRTNIVYSEATWGKLYGRNFDAVVTVTSYNLRCERVDITQEIGEIKSFTIDRAH